MKILELRFKNLNSLYGEWHIDFTHDDYINNGIFALIGPTGAGKSTVLDAICLALYGSTPRLKRITQSSNEIMSRQSGECFAEVLFLSQAGRFRCHWSQHRSRKKADGELQQPKHEISDAPLGGPGTILESKLSKVLTTVEEKTGMDFERFTRSILLAQGEFDTFLKANVEQKSWTLEQITGTEIYTEISIAVHERLRQERQNLIRVEAESKGIIVLSEEDLTTLSVSLATAEKQEQQQVHALTSIKKNIAWLQEISSLKEELEELEGEEKALDLEQKEFLPRRKQWEEAKRAADLEGSYAILKTLRNQQATEEKQLWGYKEELPALTIQQSKAFQSLTAAQSCVEKAKTTLFNAIPHLRSVRSIDQELAYIQKEIEKQKQALIQDQESLDSKRKAETQEKEKAKNEQEKLSCFQTYLDKSARDKFLLGSLTGLQEQGKGLALAQQRTRKAQDDYESAQAQQRTKEEQCRLSLKATEKVQQEYTEAQKQLQMKEQELTIQLDGKLLREYQNEKETLLREQEYLARIAALEEHRNHLEDGKACPLCGALDHPYALGNVPQLQAKDERLQALTSLLERAANLEDEIKTLEKEERKKSNALTQQNITQSLAQSGVEQAKEASNKAKEIWEEAYQDEEKIQASFLDSVAPYGVEDSVDDLEKLFSLLQKRQDTWSETQNSVEAITATLATIENNRKSLNSRIKDLLEAVTSKEKALQELEERYTKSREAREKLLGAEDPDAYEERLTKARDKAEKEEKQAQKNSDALVGRIKEVGALIDSLKTSISNREKELIQLEQTFLESIQKSSFSDEKHFLSVSIPADERSRMADKAKELDDRTTALRSKKEDRAQRLKIEEAKELTKENLADLLTVEDEQTQQLHATQQVIFTVKAQIQANQEAVKRVTQKQEGIEKQRKEYAQWEKLHSLIGSSDGKKFRNFAQGLTFENMVMHANHQLMKMSDRYLLLCDEKEPLELYVIDNYQAGEIRSIRNLSGGESFIISLSLALGLSKMASKNVRVDSLFLDEGFGTLDGESLDTALTTLASLKEDGKLIGVISHVAAMEDIIDTKITITPIAGGRSLLQGPGCMKV